MLRTIATVTVAAFAGIGLIAAPAGATASTRKTPRACLRALDRAEDVMDLAVEGFELAGEGFTAAGNLDIAGLESVAAELNSLTPTVGEARLAYDLAAITCRGV